MDNFEALMWVFSDLVVSVNVPLVQAPSLRTHLTTACYCMPFLIICRSHKSSSIWTGVCVCVCVCVLLGKLNTHEGLQGTYALLIKRYMENE